MTFDNEPGEGSGVLRSLFTAFAEALLSEEPLPRLDSLAVPPKGSCELSSLFLTHTLCFVPVGHSAAGFKGKSSRERAKSSRSSHPLQVG